MESQYTFKYPQGTRVLRSVTVAGTFNDWSPDATPLAYNPNTNTWSKEVHLRVAPLTKLAYKYVLDGTQWLCDESPCEKDAQGNQNNVAFSEPLPNMANHGGGKDNELESALGEEEPLDMVIEQKGIRSSSDSSSTVLSTLTETNSGAQNPQAAEAAPVGEPQKELATGHNDGEVAPEPKLTMWEYIKWIFKFYIFSFFSSTATD